MKRILMMLYPYEKLVPQNPTRLVSSFFHVVAFDIIWSLIIFFLFKNVARYIRNSCGRNLYISDYNIAVLDNSKAQILIFYFY